MTIYDVGRNGEVVYCEQGLEGGSWELLLNLRSTDATAQVYDSSFWNTAGASYGDVSAPFASDFRGSGFVSNRNISQILIRAHTAGSQIGYAVYDVDQAARDGRSFLELFQQASHLQLTGSRTKLVGAVSPSRLILNSQRDQPLYGDIFVDGHANPLLINRATGWGSCITQTRLATTLTNDISVHTFAGIGGRHEQACGQWAISFEAAPITTYCNLVRGYGSSTNNGYRFGAEYGGGTVDPLGSSCRASNFAWVAVDHAVYVR